VTAIESNRSDTVRSNKQYTRQRMIQSGGSDDLNDHQLLMIETGALWRILFPLGAWHLEMLS